MDRKSLRKFNLYLNSKKKKEVDSGIVKGQMGERDPRTGKYFTKLNNQGIIPTEFIGRGNSKPARSTVEIDKRGWADA